MNRLLLLTAASLLVLATACASDCDVICGKLDLCEALTTDLGRCVDRCDDTDEKSVSACTACLDDRACGEILAGTCDTPCARLF